MIYPLVWNRDAYLLLPRSNYERRWWNFSCLEKPQQQHHQRELSWSSLPDEEEENLDREMDLGKISFAKHFSLLRKRERWVSTCNMGGFGGKLCHKCPLSNYDNLTLAKWWLMDEENRWRDKTRRRLLFLLLLKSLLSSQGNFYYCIPKRMCIYFREIDVNFVAPIFETFLKWINGALHITFLLNVKFNKSG